MTHHLIILKFQLGGFPSSALRSPNVGWPQFPCAPFTAMSQERFYPPVVSSNKPPRAPVLPCTVVHKTLVPVQVSKTAKVKVRVHHQFKNKLTYI